MITLDSDYWENRYANNTNRWDLGAVSPPIQAYIDQLEHKDLRILIPGGGNAYEAEYLWKSGFRHVYVVDIAPSPLANIQKRLPDFPKDQLVLANFFELNQEFDLIIEQTFFCALKPTLRNDYVQQMKSLLATQGKLVGLLFDAPLYEDHPPFGGNTSEYTALFSNDFKLHTLAPAYNSEASRMGRELFINFRVKKK